MKSEKIKNKRRWMVAAKGRRFILLHLNKNLDQYKVLKKIPNWIIKRILK